MDKHLNNRTSQGQISIQDIFSLYLALTQVPTPTEKLNQAKSNLESIILSFTLSLSAFGATQQ